MFPVNRAAERRMSRVLEKAGRLGRTRNLQMPPRRERTFSGQSAGVPTPGAKQHAEQA